MSVSYHLHEEIRSSENTQTCDFTHILILCVIRKSQIKAGVCHFVVITHE